MLLFRNGKRLIPGLWVTRPIQRGLSTDISTKPGLSEKSKHINHGIDSNIRQESGQLFDQTFRIRGPAIIRDACKCAQCIDQSTKQREFSFAEISPEIDVETVDVRSDRITIKWKNDISRFTNHQSVYSKQEIVKLQQLSEYPSQLHTRTLWDKASYEKEYQLLSFEEIMTNDNELRKLTTSLERFGLAFITNVPGEPESCSRIAERLGPMRHSFYGKTWDVKSIPKAKNVAYTSKDLGFHMDLLYMKEPPGFQLLHCIENTCTGGESLFADTFKAVDILHQENPKHAETLSMSKIRYEYDNDGYYYTDTKPVIDLTCDPTRQMDQFQSQFTTKINRVYWSPPFVGSIASTNKNFIPAARAFAEILDRKDLIYETKMSPGTCVIFDNLRVVHARNAFDVNSGKRWLKGGYVDHQDVFSKSFSLKSII